MLDWEEGDRFSFEDSDRFEEDSLCSWSSEPESLCNNWRGWKRPPLGSGSLGFGTTKKAPEEKSAVPSLTELTSRVIASHIPFELVERVFPPVPEELQLRIAFWSFPDNEEDIRLYSCLANGSAEEFQRGDHLFRNRGVKDPLQIGFHLSASVHSTQPRSQFNVAVTFDRRRISSCNCTCTSTAYWCSHIVAVCLHRIHCATQVCLRAPVSESLQQLQRDQLQKFAQYLISELPQQILPTAQRLLDELLSSQPTKINTVCGAPDPTAGASANDQTSWYLDTKTLHDNIKKILIKFCVPAPIVFSDVNYLSTTAPPAAAEWSSLLRPLRGREPEGMWNLLSIVREMFKRTDRNAIPLLEIITEECLACDQILVWWFSTKVALLNCGGGHGGTKHSNAHSNSHASQHACSSLCDEIVVLWRLAALNPALAPHERDMLHAQFTSWHLKILEKVVKTRGPSMNTHKGSGSHRSDAEVFTGFKPAIEACYLDWEDYPIAGITHTQDTNPMYHCPFTCFRHADKPDVNQVNSSQAVLNNQHHHHHHFGHIHSKRGGRDPLELHSWRQPCNAFRGFAEVRNSDLRDGNRSSVSSEGFCENDDDPLMLDVIGIDSQEGGGSDSNSSGASCDRSKLEKVRESLKPTMSSSEDSDSNRRGTTDKYYPRGRMNSYDYSSSSVTRRGNGVPKVGNNSSDVSTPKDESDSPQEILETSRRPSKDESVSSSESQQSGDEYSHYFYDPKALTTMRVQSADSAEHSKDQVFSNLKRTEDAWDILFARAEGLHAHGHGREACTLGVRLAEELLANPPDLMIELPPVPKKKGKKHHVNPASHQLSCLASATLAKCGFLCTVLAEKPEHSHLAFRVGLFGLELPRPPASTKPLEVKLANQESDLVNLLKRIPLGPLELKVTRERAEQLKDGTLRSRGEALLPVMLASFIFDALVMPFVVNRDMKTKLLPTTRLPIESAGIFTDETLGFDAAVSALGLKANVSEADHPLLCEGTRRQRGDLALLLLSVYKNDPHKVARIMDKLLDREIHQLLKSPITPAYYSNNPPTRSQMTALRRDIYSEHVTGTNTVEMQQNDFGGNSRPQSSTSAELDSGLAGLSINTALNSSGASGTGHVTTTRTKESRYKGKRAYPSIPNQPSEASAHFMFELAKSVLTKAGGNSSTSLFTQASTTQNHHGPHRPLHMCAFQLGLYALGLHNCVSSNWLSRTYSSHVSWITGQAMDIGAHAIIFLIDTWEGHLTPPEAVSIADRASRGCDPSMVRAAAELALSCLPHAHALNPNEIQRAILQCKEQSDIMLERSCLTVEHAAKGGGVYPEVLFQVARYWYELYVRHTPGGDLDHEAAAEMHLDHNVSLIALIEPQEMGPIQQQPPPNQSVVVTTAPPPPFQSAVTTLAPIGIGPYTVAPYSFTVQGMHPHHPQHISFQHQHVLPPQPHVQMYLSPQQFQYPPPPGNVPPPQPNAYGVHPGQPACAQYSPMPHPNAGPPQFPMTNNGPAYATIPQAGGPMPPSIQYFSTTVAMPNNMPRNVASHIPAHAHGIVYPVGQQAIVPAVRQRQPHQYSQAQLRYLLAAYRVGMLSLETIARRVHDDRPQAKYARNPPYGEDIKWLLRIAKKLGTQYLHQFCVCAVNSIVSPFVLHDVAIESAHYLSRNNPGLIMQHLRSALTPLVQKCQQMYIQCMHQKLYHLTSTDYEDFVSIVCAARQAFHITPEGNTQFKEWLQSIRRSKSCKKDLWTQINAALQANGK